MNFKLEIKGSFVKIYINNTLHIMFPQQELIGIQSWKEGKNWYSIEFYLKNSTILCAYDNEKKWTSILDLMDKNL